MKIISLNTWGGMAGRQPLLDFFVAHKDVDVFCLQEIWNGGEHIRGKVMEGFAYDDFISTLYGT
jgi:exonuclease III